MKCEKCGSDNTQKLEAVYQAGTQQIHTSGYVQGAGSISTTGTSQSYLAQMAAPPTKKPVIGMLVGIAISLFLIYIAYQFPFLS